MTRHTDDNDRRRAASWETQAGPDLQADVRCACTSKAPVLITGPADVAYDLALRIHRNSPRRSEQFFVVNCADEDARHYFEHGLRDLDGTIFLLGVDRLAITLQPVLAAFLATSRARVIAATSARLVDQVASGAFDEMLFYRLNQIHLVAPASGRDLGTTPRA